MRWSHTRREFLTGAIGANVAALLAPGWLRAQADAEDPRVAEVLAGTIGMGVFDAGQIEHRTIRLPESASG